MRFNAIVSGLLFLVLAFIALKSMTVYLKKQTPNKISSWNYRWMLNGQTTAIYSCMLAFVAMFLLTGATGYYSAIICSTVLGVLCLLHFKTFQSQNKSKKPNLYVILTIYYIILIGLSVALGMSNIADNRLLLIGVLILISITTIVVWFYLNRYLYFQGNKVERS